VLIENKKNVMIRINAEVANKANEIGFNLSKIAEMALVKAIVALD
jgi:hypothetical protein